MHDVLAHRISLLSMLAGGPAYRTDLTAEETREVALAIQENAHQSLNELRTVLGTLRRDGDMEAPQPNPANLDALFDEVRGAGRVTARLGGRPGDGLRIRVSNPTPSGTSAGPGGRLGLVGLAERTRMAGGTLSHAVQDGHFILNTRLPWEASHRDSTGDRGRRPDGADRAAPHSRWRARSGPCR
ncbi:histidine kinase [Streptosporangium canum]|uniref:histidine kinase n=1 Tax=Streptosporangium canum TaxID=324952 RepID=UPI003798CDAC